MHIPSLPKGSTGSSGEKKDFKKGFRCRVSGVRKNEVSGDRINRFSRLTRFPFCLLEKGLDRFKPWGHCVNWAKTHSLTSQRAIGLKRFSGFPGSMGKPENVLTGSTSPRAQPAQRANGLNRQKGGYRVFYPSRIHYQRGLFPAFIDRRLARCDGGCADGHAAQPLPSIAVFFLPTAGFRGAGGDLYGCYRNLYYTHLERPECWSGGVVEG